MKPDYKSNDPGGWMGDMRYGAALGRSSIHDDTASGFSGKITLRRVYLDSGGYDSNGTYFGHDMPLYWYAAEDDEGDILIDDMLRASSRDDAKEQIREKYPNARFYR